MSERAQTSVTAFAAQCLALLKITGRDAGWLYLPFSIVPFLAALRLNRMSRTWVAGLFGLLVCSGPLLLAILNPSPEWMLSGFSPSVFVAFDIVLAVTIGVGLTFTGVVAARLSKESNQSGSTSCVSTS